MATSKIIRGTMILAVAAFISKFLGILFFIPYQAMTGYEGTFLYQFAYTPYAIILSISTMGLPLAVAKFVSKYNALGDYETGRRLLRSGLLLMSATGVLGFLCLFLGSPWIANLYGVGKTDVGNVVLVMRVVSIAIIIVPVMSLLRGYFQGFESMGPTAASQVAEQIVRVAFILISAFIVMVILHGSAVTAAALATFAAFVGAVAGLYVVMRYWVVRRPDARKNVQTRARRARISLLSMYRELTAYAVPFVAVGIALQLYQAIDQAMVFHYLHYGDNMLKIIIPDLTMNDQKFVMIPDTLATSLAASVVPAMIVSYAKRDLEDVNQKITQALQLVLFLTIPAVAGLSILGYTVHGLLIDISSPGLEIGGRILRWYAPSALFFSLFEVTASILQGINHQRTTLISLASGVILKLLLNPVCMLLFGMIGPIIATDIGYTVSIIINVATIRRTTGYRFSMIARQLSHIIAYTIIMLLSISLIFKLFGGTFPTSRGSAAIVLFLSIGVGCLVYLVLAKWTGLLRKIMGRSRPLRMR
ncbi:putative polysaccharide biosynthesis protein [Sporolactobacillus putidus]|uniref:Cell division protein n=1 Tax=Sporolactobacillus putidus TaxID=492735 RepID=A0A917RY98_9BACL|nr:polysaccharide biosynthesis protein [Sporolactobacillus putidus]GGL42497.1 cell division protein [Sporolactobacillus putidus]